jgi:PleD family two-component response regulator
MPEMSGFELCKQVKEDESKRHIPFVLLSTLVDSADLLRVIESGADNFIYKTFEGDYFIDRLKTIALTVNAESEAPAGTVNVSLYVKEKEHHVSLSSARLAALLSSAFEAAVVRSRAGE